MASITPGEAYWFSGPYIPDRYYYDCRPTDQLFDILEFQPIAGKEIQLNVISVPDTGLSTFADAVAAGGTLNGNMPAVTNRNYELKRIAAEMPVFSSLLAKFGSQNDLLAALLQVKVNAVRDHFKHLLIYGNETTNSEEFNGMCRRARSDAVVCARSSAVTGRGVSPVGGPAARPQGSRRETSS